jgi:hypothetical protein
MRTASLIVVVAGAAGSAHAQPLQSMAFGNDLAGGTLSIEWCLTAGGVVATTSAPIVAFGALGGMATVPGPFGGPGAAFSVVGDTFIAPWSLTNSSGNFIIGRATFDLNGSLSLFDDNLGGVAAGTPNGLDGVLGVAFLGGTAPAESSSMESDPWGHVSNVGDMYWQETIIWNRSIAAGPIFLPGQTYTWHDDTDVVPAPGSLALVGLAAALAFRRRARA